MLAAPFEKGRLRFEWSAIVPAPALAATPATTHRLTVELLSAKGESVRTLGASKPQGASPASQAPAFSLADFEAGPFEAGSRLRFRLDPPAELLLADLRIVPAGRAAAPVIVIVFDTVRADAVGFGGAPDPSTPNVDAIVRDGWTSSRAYAAASWTIPSVASLLTGRVPATHEDTMGVPLGIVPEIRTLSEDFRDAGWATAAFVANPTLHSGIGFSKGFDTFFVTPYEYPSITLPAPATMQHVIPWIAAHEGEPFFLWVHLMDPHDPYTPPDRARGVTPFDPAYSGSIVGDEVNHLLLGDLPKPPQRDIRHLTALYHDEIRYADQEIGKLWKALPEDLRRRATIIFTSDHGEEMGDHGSWKHGPTLWDEVIRVPLAIRPGEGRPNVSLGENVPVSLLDILPTVANLAGIPGSERPLDGRSLLDPDAAARKALPAITMMTGGPTRAAVVRGDSKLIFFDRENRTSSPDPTKDPDGAKLARRLPSLLPALGSFDLAADPRELELRPVNPATFGDDWRSIEVGIAHTRAGIEVRVMSPRGGGRIELAFDGVAKQGSLEPFALEEKDSLELSGDALVLAGEVAGDADGFLLRAGATPGTGPLGVTLRNAGGCVELVTTDRVRLTPGARVPVESTKLPPSIPRFETRDEACAGVYIWRAAGARTARTPAQIDEERKKLHALGYVH
ncbi:MAG: sulfatase [Thermoanaerobaculia bacterium]|nr:sulfatase [Thermoanaerobaculia bacterium]